MIVGIVAILALALLVTAVNLDEGQRKLARQLRDSDKSVDIKMLYEGNQKMWDAINAIDHELEMVKERLKDAE